MPFDWVRVLRAHGIAYVTRGPNTARDHVSVRCPWCGEADPSQHMGISLKGKGWGCLRNPDHRGRSRARLIQALLRCSSEQARRIAGEGDVVVGPPADVDFAARLKQLIGGSAIEPVPSLRLRPEFKPLRETPRAEPFWGYLRDRGYTDAGIEWLADAYRLCYARSGPYRYRIIIPIYDAHGELMTWTSRTISQVNDLRYKTHPRAQSVKDAKRLVLGLPLLWRAVNPEVLVITEGPFDAFRVTVLGHERGVYATCLFGLSISNEQMELIMGLAGRFRRLVLLLDPEASWTALRLMDRLSGLGVRIGRLPDGVEDPGTLNPRAAENLMRSWLS